MSTSFQTSQVAAVVQRGWRRRLLVLAVAQSAIALAVVFAGFALLILLGTQVLAWPWLLLIAAVGICLSVIGVRRRLSGSYAVAQMMDQHLALHDSLSTAWFLHQQGAENHQHAAAFQLNRAEELAQTADLAVAFPFERRRAWIVTAALFVLAFGLFSARYLVTQNLSLEHPFLPLAVTQVFEYVRNAITNPDHAGQSASAILSKNLPAAAGGREAPRRSQPQKPEPGQTAGQQQAKGGTGASKGDEASDQNAQPSKSADGQGGDSKQNGAGEGSKPGANAEAGKQASNDGQQGQDAKEKESTSSQHSESMMDRMRDALSSVMAKMKPPSGPKESQTGAQKSPDGQKSADQASKDQSGDGQKDAGKEQSAQEQSSGQQQGQGSAKSQASGKDSSQASDKKGSDAQSGVGHSDGDKEVRAAEQAKAMGKLAEIIGKRSASLTGDMQVEPSGKQRLQTGYTHQQGRHADLGGEINRDEVPVEDQEYVREYMELVRKKPAKATTSH